MATTFPNCSDYRKGLRHMKDSAFIRGKVPITKSEVRAVSLNKLNLNKDNIIFDIGAGTGSVSIEAAMLAPNGIVYAMERNEEACDLIIQNKEKFQVKNLVLCKGIAPGNIPDDIIPDKAFIGGTGNRMEEILDLLLEKNPKITIVINVIALESLAQITKYLGKHELDHEIISMQVSKAELVGSYHMMKGQNPIFIITING